MSKMSRKLDKKIKTMVGMYVKETDPEKAKELMQEIRSIAEDQKTLNDIEEAYKYSPGKKDKILGFLKKKREQEKLENEILKEALKEAVKNTEATTLDELDKPDEDPVEVVAEPKETAEETEES